MSCTPTHSNGGLLSSLGPSFSRTGLARAVCRGSWRGRCGSCSDIDLTLLNLLPCLGGHAADLLLRLQVKHDITQLLLELGNLGVLMSDDVLPPNLLFLQLRLELLLVGSQTSVHLLLFTQLLAQLGHLGVQL